MLLRSTKLSQATQIAMDYRHYVALRKSSKIRYQSVISVILGNISVFPDAHPPLLTLTTSSIILLVTDSQQKPNGPKSFRFYVNKFGYLIDFLNFEKL